ncbi:MAG TPA: signal peptidase II [Sedimentisphaerales bacterium]|nr:signal peptidase II [Phycisphaerae bacterium]HON92589.1 signal peptidase II [Sedimentisphaerales bacterium]HOV76806.1 signal peptidase II [Sedimentisphaerales bacterium]HQG48216.1 signal peptidase II [Sedimentisphaerales bacterium]HQI27210.1 signal peptidase II [Sedimentisphaerales bacterium]
MMDTGNQERIEPITTSWPLSLRHRIELPDATGHMIFWPVMFLGLAADLWSKHAVFAWLGEEPGQRGTIIEGFLSFQLALNEGAAFGIAGGQRPFLIGVAVLAMLVIFGVFFFGTGRQRVVQIALGLFAAGVSGNLWDRIFNDGRVRDFIDVVYWPGRHWHTFNVADAWLCLAVGLLILATFATDSSDRRRAQPQK